MRVRLGVAVGVVTGVALVSSAGCSKSGESIFAAPTPVTPVPRLLGVAFDRPAVNAGESTRGTVTLSLPASPGPLTVALSSGAAASVPGSVVVPVGSTTATFPVTTTVVSRDVDVMITASLQSVTVSNTLSLWADLPMSFTWTSDPNDSLARGGFGRITPDTATFVARCERSEMVLFITEQDGRFSSMNFGAPAGTPLRPGTYEGAARTAFRAPGQAGIDVGLRGTGCNTISGRFVVQEADFSATGDVRSFRATFEQHCNAQPPAMYGEIRLRGPFQLPPFALTCVR